MWSDHHCIITRLCLRYSARLYAALTVLLSVWASATSITSGLKACSFKVVLPRDRNPWATRTPLYPILLSAIFAVCELAWLRGFLKDGKTYSLSPHIGFIILSNSNDWLVNGTVWGFFFFILSKGIFQALLIKSISYHLVPAASKGSGQGMHLPFNQASSSYINIGIRNWFH